MANQQARLGFDSPTGWACGRRAGRCATECGMALVGSISRGTQSVKLHPTVVDMFYQVVVDREGNRYLHLSTFGSPGRASAPKSSQSLQIDAEMAKELVTLLAETFGVEGGSGQDSRTSGQ